MKASWSKLYKFPGCYSPNWDGPQEINPMKGEQFGFSFMPMLLCEPLPLQQQIAKFMDKAYSIVMSEPKIYFYECHDPNNFGCPIENMLQQIGGRVGEIFGAHSGCHDKVATKFANMVADGHTVIVRRTSKGFKVEKV